MVAALRRRAPRAGSGRAFWSVVWRVGAAAASALLLAAAFPPLEWTGLAFAAWTPLAFARAGASPRLQRLLGGLFVGVLYGLLAASVDPPEVVTGAAWVGVSLAVGAAAFAAAVLLAAPFGPQRLTRALGAWTWIWAPALIWTGIEYLRLVTTAGHQWGMLAAAQVDAAPLRAWLPLAGMWPVTLATVAAGQSIAALLLAAAGRLAMTRGLAAAIGAAAVFWLVGLAFTAAPRTILPPPLRVAVIQTGEHVPAHPQTKPLIETVQYAALTDVITGLHAPATIDAGRRGAQLVVWPEASGWVAPDDPSAEPQLQRVLDTARQAGAAIVWPYFIRIDPNRTRNEIVLATPDGRLSAPTTKDHPVYAIRERSVTSGLHPVYQLRGLRVGLAAGPDGTYTDTLARLAARGASLVAIPTHDWAAFTSQHVRHLRLRAAEHRLTLVKADWRYGSVVIDAHGQVIAAAPLREPQAAVLLADVIPQAPGTLYTATGDWMGAAALAAWAALLAGSVGLELRRRVSGGWPESPRPPS